MISWFSILLVIISFALIVQMLRIYPSKVTPFYIYGFVFIGWWLPFVSIALVPFDVYCAVSGQDPGGILYVAWELIYWVTFAFCWVVLPLFKNFLTAGEFTFWTKAYSAFMVRIRYMLVLMSLFIAFIIYLAVVQHLDKETMSAFLAAMGNVWGLLMIIILMGYGVVAIPRIWWYKGDYTRSLNYLYLKAVQLDEKRIDAGYELDQVILRAIALEKESRYDKKLNTYAQCILSSCPKEELELNRNRTYNLPPAEKLSVKGLVELNQKLLSLKAERVRLECRWDHLLGKAFAIQDIIENKDNPNKKIVSFFWPQKSGKLVRVREVLEWFWWTKCFPIVSKILSVFFVLFSIVLLLGETTLFINTDVGIFSLFFKNDHGDVVTQILCFIPMSYIFSTTYIGLFTLKIPGSYGLYDKNHTDPANLVWSAYFTSRLVQPLIYNFLLYIKVNGTQFQEVMGVMSLVPFLGIFSTYFPILIVFFAVLNAFDFYTWIMVKLGVPQLSFADNFDKGRLDEGIVLIKKARSGKEKGIEHKPIVPQSYETQAKTPKAVQEVQRSISMSKNPSKYEDIKKRMAANKKDSIKTPLRS